MVEGNEGVARHAERSSEIVLILLLIGQQSHSKQGTFMPMLSSVQSNTFSWLPTKEGSFLIVKFIAWHPCFTLPP